MYCCRSRGHGGLRSWNDRSVMFAPIGDGQFYSELCLCPTPGGDRQALNLSPTRICVLRVGIGDSQTCSDDCKNGQIGL